MSRSIGQAAYHPATRRIAVGLRRRCGVREHERLLVAVSGGADSTALLRALHLLASRRTWRLNLVVGHVHHHLRSAEAEADAQFARQLAGNLDLGFHRRDVYPNAEQQNLSNIDVGGNLEQRARQLRYAALARIAREVRADAIVTAHHADDQLETLVMRMIRGTGVQGMRGIAWRRRVEDRRLIRPMLGVSRDEARDLLSALGQTWREDRTNQDLERDRARLRSQVMPVLRDLRPDSPRRAVSLSDDARRLNAMVNEQAAQAEDAATQPNHGQNDSSTLVRSTLSALTKPVLARLLRNQLTRRGVGPDSLGRQSLNQLSRAIRDGHGGQREFHFANGVQVTLTAQTVDIHCPD